MVTEDPWDAPDPTKLRISAVSVARADRRPPVKSTSSAAAPPPHHASPAAQHGVIDEAAVEAPPIPRPVQPQAPKPAMIDTRVSRGEPPVMVDGFHGASWRNVDDMPSSGKLPAVRPWARHAAITIGAVATLTILGAVVYVLGVAAIRAVKETDPEHVTVPVVAPAPPTRTEPATFESSHPPTSIIGEGEVPVAPIELPPEVDAYGEDMDDEEPSLDDLGESE